MERAQQSYCFLLSFLDSNFLKSCDHAAAAPADKSLWLCPTLCEPIDCGLPGSSAHGISQDNPLEWVAIFFSRASSPTRD